MPTHRDAPRRCNCDSDGLQRQVLIVLVLLAAGSVACLTSRGDAHPAIEFGVVPEAGSGGPARLEPISGKVTGAKRNQRVVLYARSGTWWVQPLSTNPFTPIQPDSTWNTKTHVGSDYAALLVDEAYVPRRTTDVLPGTGNGVVAVATVAGRTSASSEPSGPSTVLFAGYEWQARQIPSDSGGVMHLNRASNAWTDAAGRLHLRIAREGKEWTCAEVYLTRSLGYGTYIFRVDSNPILEPATVLGMFTWDEMEAGQNHREIDIELSRWGDPTVKNAQFVIQPYYRAANVFRFVAPTAARTYSFRWEAGRVTFKSAPNGIESGPSVAEHVFTSGIPTPGSETAHINLYIYGKARTPQQRGVEVVIGKFQFLP